MWPPSDHSGRRLLFATPISPPFPCRHTECDSLSDIAAAISRAANVRFPGLPLPLVIILHLLFGHHA